MNTTTEPTTFDVTDEFLAVAEAAEAAGMEFALVHNVDAHTFWLMLCWGEDTDDADDIDDDNPPMPHPSGFVYMFEDGGCLAYPDPLYVPVGPDELAALVAINGALDGGLVAGLRVRADRDGSLGASWRQLANRVAEADGRFSVEHYTDRYRTLVQRLAADEEARYARRESAA